MYTFHYTRWNFIHPFCFALVKVEIHLGNQLYSSEADQCIHSWGIFFKTFVLTLVSTFSCLKIPPCLKQNNVEKDDIREMSDLKVKRICHHFNPLRCIFKTKSWWSYYASWAGIEIMWTLKVTFCLFFEKHSDRSIRSRSDSRHPNFCQNAYFDDEVQ